MKIKRSDLSRAISEEFIKLVKEEAAKRLREAPEDDEGEESAPKKDPKGAGKEPPKEKSPKKDGPAPKKEPPKEKSPKKPETGPEVQDDDEQEAKSKISSELVGKTVQSITMEPKSQVIPGGQEVVLTFDQTTDPLRIIVTKSGQVAFYYRGLHKEV